MRLDTQLNQLEYADLVRFLLEEEPTYTVKHALVQDMANGSWRTQY